MKMTFRNEGKSLLRLLECYVLDVIGQLSTADRSNLERMTPKLQAVYKTNGDWRDIISQVMHFPGTLDDSIKLLWARHLDRAAKADEKLLADDFARMIVDESLAKR